MNVYIRAVCEQFASLGVPVDTFVRALPGVRKPEVIPTGPRSRLIRLPVGAARWREKFPAQAIRFARREGTQYRGIVSQYWLSGLVGDQLRTVWQVPHLAGFHTLALAKRRAVPGEPLLPERVAGERMVVARADGLLATSSHEAEVLTHSYNADPRKIHLASPGVAHVRFRPLDRLECRQSLDLPLHQPVVLFVGRMVPLKGLPVLLRAVARANRERQLVAVIAGGAAGCPYSMEMRALAGQLGLTAAQVRFTGPVPHEMLPPYYGAADVCALPSHYESFGMVALEAMACGRPVIASKVGGLESLVVDNRTGLLVPPGSAADCYRALDAVLGNPQFRDEAGAAGVRHARRFTWDATASNILRALEDVANRQAA